MEKPEQKFQVEFTGKELQYVVEVLVTEIEVARDTINNSHEGDDVTFEVYRKDLFKELIKRIQQQVNHQWVDVDKLDW